MAQDMAGKSSVVSVRLPADEFARLKELADREGVPVSAVVRRAVQTPVVGDFPIAIHSATRSWIGGTGSQSGYALIGTYTVPEGANVCSVRNERELNLRYPD